MSFSLRPYTPPDFTQPFLADAPDVCFQPTPFDGVAPEQYHAMSIFRNISKSTAHGYWQKKAAWTASLFMKMENHCTGIPSAEKGDLIAIGRTEDGSQGIYVHANGFSEERELQEVFAFRQGRSRETAFSKDYNELYEILRHDRDHGKIIWVLGPAFTFDKDARDAFPK